MFWLSAPSLPVGEGVLPTPRPNEGPSRKALAEIETLRKARWQLCLDEQRNYRSLCCSWADDNTLRWFLEEPEMQPGDSGDGLELRELFRGEVGQEARDGT